MKQEKEGFVYIWYDRKHKRYYIGCRWGNIDDGYICSSSWMKKTYKYRPQDFKRRILKKGISQKNLLMEEYRWLKLIKDEELGKRYYNLSNRHFGHWSANEKSRLTVGQKISNAPNRKQKIGIANKGKKPAINTIEATVAVRLGKTYEDIYGYERAQKIKKKQQNSRKPVVWTDDMRREAGERSKKHLLGKKASIETRQKMRESQLKRYRMDKE